MNIADIEIGGMAPCRTVAEVSNNHNGGFDRCLRLIEEAQRAGADFVKFQCYTPDELMALRGDGPAPEPWGGQGWSMHDLYTKAQTPLDWFPKLAQQCRDIGMPWFSSVFGADSFAVLRSLDCPAYKIAALDNKNIGLNTQAHMAGRPVVVSANTPPAGPFEDRYDLLLYCPRGYPTPATEVSLPLFYDAQGVLGWDAETSDYHGLSSHCLAPELPVAAVARGAKLIEMHFMLAEEPGELESDISLTQYQWRGMVDSIRRTEEMLG